MTTIIELKNVVKRFSGLTAVNKIKLRVKERSIHALIGPNGSGKTTTINVINGFLPIDEGKVIYKEEDITGLKVHEIARKGIGRTFQNLKLYTSMTAKENLLTGGHSITKLGIVNSTLQRRKALLEEQKLSEKADEILASLNLYNIKNENVSSLPYGTRKMVELGRTLMYDPELILLDEPAAGLTTSERKKFVQILQNIFEKGIELFLIEHNMDVTMNLCDMITVINFGSIIAEGSPKEIQNNPEVIRAYLGDRYQQI